MEDAERAAVAGIGIGEVDGGAGRGGSCARIAASSPGQVLDREQRRHGDAAAVEATLALEGVEHGGQVGSGRNLEEEETRSAVASSSRTASSNPSDDGSVRAEAVMLLAALVETVEKGSHAIQAGKRCQAARAEAVRDDDRAIVPHQPEARKGIARVGRIGGEERLPAARRAGAVGGGPERRAGMHRAAGGAHAAGDDESDSRAAASGRTGTPRRRSGDVVVHDQRLDLGTERRVAAAGDGHGGLGSCTPHPCRASSCSTPRPAGQSSRSQAWVAETLPGRERNGRVVVELHGERGGIGVGSEAQQHEQVSAGDVLV